MGLSWILEWTLAPLYRGACAPVASESHLFSCRRSSERLICRNLVIVAGVEKKLPGLNENLKKRPRIRVSPSIEEIQYGNKATPEESKYCYRNTDHSQNLMTDVFFFLVSVS